MLEVVNFCLTSADELDMIIFDIGVALEVGESGMIAYLHQQTKTGINRIVESAIALVPAGGDKSQLEYFRDREFEDLTEALKILTALRAPLRELCKSNV